MSVINKGGEAKFIHAWNQSQINDQKDKGRINDNDIIFNDETQEILTKGKSFGGSPGMVLKNYSKELGITKKDLGNTYKKLYENIDPDKLLSQVFNINSLEISPLSSSMFSYIKLKDSKGKFNWYLAVSSPSIPGDTEGGISEIPTNLYLINLDSELSKGEKKIINNLGGIYPASICLRNIEQNNELTNTFMYYVFGNFFCLNSPTAITAGQLKKSYSSTIDMDNIQESNLTQIADIPYIPGGYHNDTIPIKVFKPNNSNYIVIYNCYSNLDTPSDDDIKNTRYLYENNIYEVTPSLPNITCRFLAGDNEYMYNWSVLKSESSTSDKLYRNNLPLDFISLGEEINIAGITLPQSENPNGYIDNSVIGMYVIESGELVVIRSYIQKDDSDNYIKTCKVYRSIGIKGESANVTWEELINFRNPVESSLDEYKDIIYIPSNNVEERYSDSGIDIVVGNMVDSIDSKPTSFPLYRYDIHYNEKIPIEIEPTTPLINAIASLDAGLIIGLGGLDEAVSILEQVSK